MTTIVTVSAPLTVHDLPDQDEAWPRHELIDGSLLVTPAPGLPHQGVVAAVLFAVNAAAPADVRVLPGANVIPDDGTLIIPDVVAIGDARLREGGLGVAPQDLLLAVEVESRSTRRRDRTLKRSLYEEWGVPYLLVDPTTQTLRRFGTFPEWPLDLDAVFD